MDHLARFRPHPRGFGFLHLTDRDGLTEIEATVTRDDGPPVTADRAFVPPPLAKGLVADDLVVARLSADGRGLAAESIEITARPRRMLVGTLVRGPGRLVLDPDRGLATGWIDLDDQLAATVAQSEGRVIVVLRGHDTKGAPLAKALVAGPMVAGSPQAVRAISTVVAYERAAVDPTPAGPAAADLDPGEAAITHARFVGIVAGGGRGGASGLATDADEAPGALPGAGLVPIDRTGEATFTVDAVSAKDLDDAISASWSGVADDPIHVAVHIADVAGVVAVNSPADRYARTVASTAYPVIGANAPMLDPALSEDQLSLLPGQTRQTLSARFAVAGDGQLSNVTIELATIVSDARLSYEAVEGLLDGDPSTVNAEIDETLSPHADATAIIEAVSAAIEAARRLGVERDGRATFDQLFADALWEPALVDGRLAVVAASLHAHAYRLIERLMVAANEAVANFLVTHDVPALYRVHVGLDPTRLDRLAAAAQQVGVTLPGLTDPGDGDHLMGEVLAAIDELASQGRAAERDLLVAVAAGSMARASYDPDPTHHRGLAATAYTHFTSPIRRYADLVVHRQLRAALAGMPPVWSTDRLVGLATWLDHRSSALSMMQAMERRMLWSLLLDRGHIEDELEAVVTGLTVNGAHVRVVPIGLTGFITAERLLGLPTGQRGALVIDEQGLTTTSGPFAVGTRMMVRFVGLDDSQRPIWRPQLPPA